MKRTAYLRKKRKAKKHEQITMGKENRIRDDKHRKWISTLPCCVTYKFGETQCAHVSDGRYSMGLKQSDDFCVPLSFTEHSAQHNHPMGEVGYWEEYGGISKVKRLAKSLYDVSLNTEAAVHLIEEFNDEWRL